MNHKHRDVLLTPRTLWCRHRTRGLAVVRSPMKIRVVDKDVEEHDEEEHDLVEDPVQQTERM